MAPAFVPHADTSTSQTNRLLCRRRMGHFVIARSVRLSVPRRSCLGYRHAGCLQLSRRRPPEMHGLRTRPRTDVDPPRILPPSNCHRRGGGHIVSPPPVRYLVNDRVNGRSCSFFRSSVSKIYLFFIFIFFAYVSPAIESQGQRCQKATKVCRKL